MGSSESCAAVGDDGVGREGKAKCAPARMYLRGQCDECLSKSLLIGRAELIACNCQKLKNESFVPWRASQPKVLLVNL